MKRLLGLRSLAAVAVAAAAVGSIAGGFAGTAGAAGTTPPWEVTGTGYGSVGALTFTNASGQQITGGDLTDAPIAAYVEGSSTVRSGDTKATLYAYTPVDGVAPGDWSGQALSASTTYPDASAPAPLNTATLPVVTGASGDESLSEYIAQYPNGDTSSDGYAGLYQLRLKTTASGQPGNTTYDSADILVSGSTWSVVYPSTVTTTALTSVPAGPATFGSSVQLTATVSPSTATGTVQFRNGSANIGAPVTVSGGTASTTTSSLPVGSENLYAVFTPDATSAGDGLSASSGSLPFTVQTGTSTTLTTSPTGTTTVGTSVQLNAAVTPTTATGSVQFEDDGTPVGGPVTVSGGTASTTTSSLPAGDLTLEAVFTPTGTYAASSGTASLAVDGAPSIMSAASTTFAAGTAGTFQVTATGYPAATISETGALPSGVTLSSSGLLSGTPAGGCTTASYPITLQASNGVGSPATQNFTLDVGGTTAFAVCPPAQLGATPGTAYSGTFTTINQGAPGEAAAPKLKWSATGVPAGFKFSKGVLSDTSGKKMVAGDYGIDVTVVESYTVDTTTVVKGKTKVVKTKESGTASLTVTLSVS